MRPRLDRHEIAGSLGDLGTFLPLLVGMSAQNGLNFGTALFFAGLWSVLTGLIFSIPMAVQPMKAIAAVALTEHLSASQIGAAGAGVSLLVLLLGLTGLIDWVDRVVPRSVVRGIQLALGLSLFMKGVQMVAGTGRVLGADSYVTGALAAIAALLFLLSRSVPAALLLFCAGVVLTLRDPGVLRALSPGLWLPHFSPPSLSDFAVGFVRAGVPQLPLTTLNSVIAVCALSGDLFPDRPARPRRVAVSVGLMNLVGVWFGAMPMCHGAGGLAGQYRFGARTGGSILFLGGMKLIVAVLFGSSLMVLCQHFPASILGVMLAFSGIELSLVVRDQTSRTAAFLMLTTAASCLALNNIALGFLIGLLVALGVRVRIFRVE